MNFSRNINSGNKGSFIWKRKANTSNTNHKSETYKQKKVRISSQFSDYTTNLHQTQNNIQNRNTNIKVPTKSISKLQNSEWSQLKSIAKRTTIASRIQLKKSHPTGFLDMNENKSTRVNKSFNSMRSQKLDSTSGNQAISSKKIKQAKQFQSLNPHIFRDVHVMKKRVCKMYQNEKREMDIFLAQSNRSSQVQTLESVRRRVENKAKSMHMGCSSQFGMNQISQRQEYSSRINTNRMNQSNKDINGYERDTKQITKNPYLQPQAREYPNQNRQVLNEKFANRPQNKSANRPQNKSAKANFAQDICSSQNGLLKGLLGEYSNYQKLSKSELIKKLISLEYLAQNIFKRNKFLQEKLGRKEDQPEFVGTPGVRQRANHSQILYLAKQRRNLQQTQLRIQLKPKKLLNKQPQLTPNDNGYFTQFLESQKGKQKLICYPQEQKSSVYQKRKQACQRQEQELDMDCPQRFKEYQ